MSTLLSLHTPRKTQHYYSQGIWTTDTFYSLLLQHTKLKASAFAARDNRRRISRGALLQEVDRIAAYLHSIGLRPGDRVAVWLPSCVESIVVFLACSRNGYVCCPSLHKNHTVQDVITLLNKVRCKVLFTQLDYGLEPEKGIAVSALIKGISTLKKVVAVPSEPMAVKVLPDSVVPYPNDDIDIEQPFDNDPDAVLYLAFTSGTTGAPKGVMHSDNTLLANARSLVEDWQLHAESIVLTLSSMSHHIGTVALAQALVAGAEIVLSSSSNPKQWLDWIIESKATYLLGVPTHGIDLLNEMKQRGLKKMGQTKVFYLSGSVIPPGLAQDLFNLGITPQNAFGMSENSSHHYTLPSDPESLIVNTCGRSCKGYETRIWKQDDPDTEAEPGEIGELGGRGGLLMLGYYNNQEATEDSFNAHGWFLTGDLGTIDEQGYLRIVGRKKEIIIRGGRNIYPGLIEDLAHSHSCIRQAAVFPVPDTRLGEKACLAITLEANCHVEPQALLDYLYEQGLSKYDMPEYMAIMLNFPMTSSGKILKRELENAVKRGELIPEAVRWQQRNRVHCN